MAGDSGDDFGKSWPPDDWWAPDAPDRDLEALPPDTSAPTSWPPASQSGSPPPSWSPPPPPPIPPVPPAPSPVHTHHADRMTLGVAALVLVVFCGAIGFAIGRASAPKNTAAPSPFVASPYTYRTIPRDAYPPYTYPSYMYPRYTYPTYTSGTQPRYGVDPSGNTYTEAGVFTITFPGTHNYPIVSWFNAAGTYTRGHIVQSAATASPRGFFVEWSDPSSTTTTSQAAASACTTSTYRAAQNAGPSTIAGRSGYTCRIDYGSGVHVYTDYAYLVANNRVFIFETSEASGATYAQFLAFVASFRLL